VCFHSIISGKTEMKIGVQSVPEHFQETSLEELPHLQRDGAEEGVCHQQRWCKEDEVEVETE
jgi:hypothetical protein